MSFVIQYFIFFLLPATPPLWYTFLPAAYIVYRADPFCWMDFGFPWDSEKKRRHAVKSFGFFHSISIQKRILITGFEQASVWFQATLTVPVGNSRADHSGNEHGGDGCNPGVRSSRGSWERVVGGSLGDSKSTLWSFAININFRRCYTVMVQWPVRMGGTVILYSWCVSRQTS